MRIALCVFGHFRDYERTYLNWKKYLLPYVDVYISSWMTSGLDKCRIPYDVGDVVGLYKPVRYEFSPEMEFDTGRYPCTTRTVPNSTISMFYQIEKCVALISKPLEYDLIVRIRPDIYLTEQLSEQILSVDATKLTVFNRPDDVNIVLFSDILFCGPPCLMVPACKLYSGLDNLYGKTGVLCPHICVMIHLFDVGGGEVNKVMWWWYWKPSY